MNEDVGISDIPLEMEEGNDSGTCLDDMDMSNSEQRAVGPMDKFTRPIDPNSSAYRRNQQQTISQHIMKERSHKLKRYIARRLYVQGN